LIALGFDEVFDVDVPRGFENLLREWVESAPGPPDV